MTAYAELLIEAMPARIETDEQYNQVHARFGQLFDKRSKRTPEETKLMRLLGVLVQDYDERLALPDDSTPAQLLEFLVEQSGESASRLLTPVFGQRSHVTEALNGKRPISAAQARKLGELFSVKPGLFI